MQIFLVAALTLINLLLWLVFFVKFKKLFSIDNIMQEFRVGMERLLQDAQRQTVSCVSLIEDKIKEMKSITAQTERRLATLRRDAEISREALSLQSSISPASSEEKPRAKRKSASKTVAEKYKKNGVLESMPSADESYMLTSLFRENASQRSLFEEGRQSVFVNNEGDSYGKVPIVKPEIVVSDSPIVKKKDFARQVKDLNALGKSVEEIAAETSHSTTEVQLVLDML